MNIKKFAAGCLMAVFAAATTVPAHADNAPAQRQTTIAAEDMQNANTLRLAYITSSSSLLNEESQQGLEALVDFLKAKTSVEPAGVIGRDIELDEISYYPFIYWPVAQDAATLSPAAQKKVQNFINTGGVILFDVQNFDPSVSNAAVLRTMLGAVSLKPLTSMQFGHTLSKTFYILQGMPGSNGPADTLVEEAGQAGVESVSSVIVSDSNYAGAWAGVTVQPGSREREMALRSGVNIVMYALTGDYKSDLVHVPELLEKMGAPN